MAADEGTSGDTTTAPMVEVGAMSTGAKKTRRRVKKVAQEEKVTKTHVATAEELTQAKLDPLLKGQSLFTPQGRPRVQQQIRYNDLLDAIRNKEVKELVMTPQGTDRCMALFKDGRVRLLQLPADDHVVADMMSVHGVSAVLAKSEPPPDPSMAATRRMDIASYWLPSALILAVYSVVMYRTRQKGDWDDRVKLRKLDAENARAKKKAQQEAQLLEEERRAKMALMAREEGLSMAEYRKKLQAEKSSEEGKIDMDFDGAKTFMSVNAAVQYRQPEGSQELDEKKKRLFGDDQKKASVVLGKQMKDRITFDDVAGIGEAKLELMEVVDFFKKPEKYRASGSRIPKGILLAGPPGTGKTLLARAVAGESGVAFFSMTASEFVEMFVGVGAARVRDLFGQAKKAAPAIIFIDELDAVGRKRGGGGGGNDERDQTLNQMLSELDGFGEAGKNSIVVIAATNRPDVLDPALVRPGRFDRKVVVQLPDALGRYEILKVHVASKPMADDVNLLDVAYATTGYTGAALANIINLGALLAAKDNRDKIRQSDLTGALELETLGKVAQEANSDQRQKRLAVHEGAKALMAELLPDMEPVEMVTVVPREANTDGQLRLVFNEDRAACGTWSRAYLHQQTVMLMAGRAAEMLEYGLDQMSTMNEDSIDAARNVATKMVLTSGFCDDPRLNRRAMALSQQMGDYLNAAATQYVPAYISEETDAAMHAAIKAQMDAAYTEAKALLEAHKPLLEATVARLVTDGTLTGMQLRSLMREYGATVVDEAVVAQAVTKS